VKSNLDIQGNKFVDEVFDVSGNTILNEADKLVNKDYDIEYKFDTKLYMA
jgi:hypothetical protein